MKNPDDIQIHFDIGTLDAARQGGRFTESQIETVLDCIDREIDDWPPAVRPWGKSLRSKVFGMLEDFSDKRC